MSRSRKFLALVAVVLLPLAACSKTAAAPNPRSGKAIQDSLDHYKAGRYQDALAAAKTAVSEDPKSVEAYNNMAVSYLALEMYDEGIHAAQEALRLKPDFQLAKNNLAWIQREKAKAASAPPPTASSLLNESLQHAVASRFQQCFDVAAQAAKLDPKLAEAFNNAGFCAWRLQRWDDAVRNTQEAIRLNPNFQRAKNNLAAMQKDRLVAEGPTSR